MTTRATGAVRATAVLALVAAGCAGTPGPAPPPTPVRLATPDSANSWVCECSGEGQCPHVTGSACGVSEGDAKRLVSESAGKKNGCRYACSCTRGSPAFCRRGAGLGVLVFKDADEPEDPVGPFVRAARARCRSLSGDTEAAVALVLSVGSDGSVDASLNTKEDREPTPLEACVLREVRRWKLPRETQDGAWVTIFFPWDKTPSTDEQPTSGQRPR